MALLVVRFVDESTGFLAPSSIEQFHDQLGISYGSAGAMFVAYGVGGVAGNVVVAWTDGRSRRGVTVGGTYVLALGIAVDSLAGGGPARATAALLLGAFLIAAGATGMVHGGEITMANALDAGGAGQHLERLLARTNLLAVAGDVAGPVFVAATRAAGVGWRPLFVGTSVAVAVYATFLATLTFPPPAAPVDEAGRVPVIRQATVWLIAVAAFAAMPLDESYLATVLAFAETGRGFSPSAAALLGVAFAAGGVLTFTAFPDVISRTPLHRLLAVCGVGMSALMAVAALGPAWALVPVGFAHSALLAATWVGLQALVLRVNPGREGATKLVVEVLEALSFGIVVAIGVLADREGLAWAMAAFAAVPLLLAAVATRLRTPPGSAASLPGSRST